MIRTDRGTNQVGGLLKGVSEVMVMGLNMATNGNFSVGNES